MREIKIVYQDCPMCGARYNWGLKQTEVAARNNITLIKTPFYKPGVGKLIQKAIENGVGTMPFFTDGEKFSTDLEDFIEKPAKKITKRTKNGTAK